MINTNTSTKPPIRVLLVEDSPVQLHVIKKTLSFYSDIEVVGTAFNGQEALDVVLELKPDVICTDFHMPIMDGLEFIKQVIEIFPCPILVLSISVMPNQMDNIFKMLSAGAIDVLSKPMSNGELITKELGTRLAEKIRILNGVRYIPKHSKLATQTKPIDRRSPLAHQKYDLIVIGSSAGGLKPLTEIISQLGKGFSIPIVCVQHMGAEFVGGMISWLGNATGVNIAIATNGMNPSSNCVYFASGKDQLTINTKGELCLVAPISSDYFLSSINNLFESAAKHYGKRVIGIILSGMGNDGVEGLKKIHDSGGVTIAQDEQSCAVYGMPMQAIDTGAANSALSPQEIVDYLRLLAK